MVREITSSKQALAESQRLKSIWSKESRLTQRTLIYCASLLEQLVGKQRTPRVLSKWQKFLSAEMKRGVSIREAAEKWREKGRRGAKNG